MYLTSVFCIPEDCHMAGRNMRIALFKKTNFNLLVCICWYHYCVYGKTRLVVLIW